MEINLDVPFQEKLIKLLVNYEKDNGRKPDNLYHVSDILNPRWKYYTQKYQYKTMDSDFLMFIPGIAFHEYLQKRMGPECAEQTVSMPPDIIGNVDMVGTLFSEIKTSRKWTIPEYPEVHYVEQFQAYLSMADKEVGWIIVIYFTANRSWDGKSPSTLEIRSWKVSISSEERQEIRENIIKIRNALHKTITKTQNIKSLPLCWEFKCFSAYKGKLSRTCPFIAECQPGEGRYDKYLKMSLEADRPLVELDSKALTTI